MTSPRKTASNRSNAAKSTGPKTKSGKRASSRNSRKHGATARLASEEVLAWYRTIVDNPRGLLPGPGATDLERAAVELAESEVRLKMCDDAEDAAIQELLSLKESGGGLENIGLVGVHPIALQDARRLIGRLDRLNEDAAVRSCGLARRYHREAEAKRRTAFARWVQVKVDFPKRSQTQP